MKLTLVVLRPANHFGEVIRVAGSTFLIGRDPKCQLRPASAQISRCHCELKVCDGTIFVHDLNSANGTFVNDQPVQAVEELHHEDRLRVGPLEFEVFLDEEVQSLERTDDEAAALLLSLEEVPPLLVAQGKDAQGIPEGGTAPNGPVVQSQPEAEKKAPSTKAEGDSSAAARAILELYMRRPRNAQA